MRREESFWGHSPLLFFLRNKANLITDSFMMPVRAICEVICHNIRRLFGKLRWVELWQSFGRQIGSSPYSTESLECAGLTSWGWRFSSHVSFEIGMSCTMNPFFEHAFLKQEQLLQKSICVGTSSHFNFTIGKFWDHYGDERRSLKRTRKITRSLVRKARKSEKWTKNGLILKMTFFWEAGFQVQSLPSIIMIRPVLISAQNKVRL